MKIWKLLNSNVMWVALGYFAMGPYSPLGHWVGDPIALSTWLSWHMWLVIGCVGAWIEVHDHLSKHWGLKTKDGKWIDETLNPQPTDWNAKAEVQKYLEKKD